MKFETLLFIVCLCIGINGILNNLVLSKHTKQLISLELWAEPSAVSDSEQSRETRCHYCGRPKTEMTEYLVFSIVYVDDAQESGSFIACNGPPCEQMVNYHSLIMATRKESK